MPAPYIPNKDAQLDAFTTNFSALITTSPTTYGLVAADATTIAAVRLTFHTAYLAAVNVLTRGPTTITAKDTAKVLMLATLRPYAQQIANNGGVSSANKIALGLNPRTNVPTPVAAPTTQPNLTIVGGAPLQLFMRYHDSSAAPSSKQKPAGAIQMQLFGAVSATVITDPTTLPLINVFTKSPFIQTWPAGSSGKTAYMTARWVTRTGLVGPFTAIVSSVIM